jgi:hypothetical protein
MYGPVGMGAQGEPARQQHQRSQRHGRGGLSLIFFFQPKGAIEGHGWSLSALSLIPRALLEPWCPWGVHPNGPRQAAGPSPLGAGGAVLLYPPFGRVRLSRVDAGS